MKQYQTKNTTTYKLLQKQTFKNSAKACLVRAFFLALCIASEKLFRNELYTSNTIAFENCNDNITTQINHKALINTL